MNLSAKNLVKVATETGFIRNTVEKAMRLVDILELIAESPWNDKLVLKGATAINLFYFDMPRLSVDIDLDYAVAAKDEMQKDRELIKDFLTRALAAKGYFLNTAVRTHYALGSFVFTFANSVGNKDTIKVDINYLDRIHILKTQTPVINNSVIKGAMPIQVLDKHELFGSKLAALVDRCTPRDLYDTYGLINFDLNIDAKLLRKCAVFYNCVGGNADLDRKNYSLLDSINKTMIIRTLKPVLANTDRFDYVQAVSEVKNYLNVLFTLDDGEIEFIKSFQHRQYKPELLFGSVDIINRIKEHPMALWKCRQ
ncbi:MAG: nucleotidyl transferase AbiEii/AbiGii toxin family protein [Christensenellaceae bacterium]|jgi:predicted nucleotidyltransferase component of viral defense system|nr:nucleotidyl transferase AbiEii/AbiGii toxin family protein [Christensenellaceae bacterium]